MLCWGSFGCWGCWGVLAYLIGEGRLYELHREEMTVAQERAVLVAVITPESRIDLRNPLAELESLAEAAGAMTVDAMVQKRRRPCNTTYLGKGKLEELRERCEASEAGVVIFDHELTPAQLRNVEKVVQLKILDRSELILDIFATRARTHEARLQVELAQLQYTAPRIRGMWSHLERIAGAGGGTAAGAVGGIGTRGPGERQIEIDRRIVTDRVAYLKRQISDIDRRKTREVKSRAKEFTVSLVGYTNSGKSTLMNTLTNAGRKAEDALFVTLDTKTVRWDLDERKTVLLSDTVGFVRDLPHRLVASFRATLEEAIHADLLLHVVDASIGEASEQVRAVREVLEELGCAERATVVLLNKMDAAKDLSAIQILQSQIQETVRISAKTGEGLGELIDVVLSYVTSGAVDVTLRIPVADGKLLAAVGKSAQVKEQRYDEQHVEMDVNLDRVRLDQLLNHFGSLEVVGGDK